MIIIAVFNAQGDFLSMPTPPPVFPFDIKIIRILNFKIVN